MMKYINEVEACKVAGRGTTSKTILTTTWEEVTA